MAEKEGFEPSVQSPVHMISSQAHSTTLAFLRCTDYSLGVCKVNDLFAFICATKAILKSKRRQNESLL